MTSGLATETEAMPGTAAIGRPNREDEVPLVAGQRPLTPTGTGHSLYFGLLGHFQGVIDLDAEITNRTLQLRVS
jgi:hypothetical protein